MKLKNLILVAALMIYTTTTAQVNAGQIDDFENGTEQNWTDGGSPSPPVNISSGGPNGSNDNYLRNVSLGGNGAGSKMVMFNDQQWAGNYINESIVAIKFDARVLSATLNVRVAFDGAGGRICTTNPVTVAEGGNWTQVVIPITASDFTMVAGGFDISQTLADVSDLRILSNSAPSWQGESIAATLEIDNIEAAMTLSLTENSFTSTYRIIPNPAKDFLMISTNSFSSANAELIVYDSLGKHILSRDLKKINTKIPVSNWNSGIYFIQLKNNKTSQVKRFVKL